MTHIKKCHEIYFEVYFKSLAKIAAVALSREQGNLRDRMIAAGQQLHRIIHPEHDDLSPYRLIKGDHRQSVKMCDGQAEMAGHCRNYLLRIFL